MKITLTTSPLKLAETHEEWVAERLVGLSERRRMDEAVVQITKHEEASPAWEVKIHLVTLGPDLTAVTRDHTMAAAFAKNVAELEGILDAREAKRASKHKGEGPSNPPASYIG